ncbi:hypothetical protein LCGC14_2576580 [marine sediment metagenome]|uniref:Uncharacterized protein n=1 Tax=marine sediment metagenome TaxID=412755 RepID=A0A0F9AG35_9ZZZZ
MNRNNLIKNRMKNRKKYIHHEENYRTHTDKDPEIVECEVEYPSNGGYFGFNHINCKMGKSTAMRLVFIYIDGGFHRMEKLDSSRVVLVFECIKCKHQQAFKELLHNDYIEIEMKDVPLRRINYLME